MTKRLEGFAYCRDKPTETVFDVLKWAFKRHKEKFGFFPDYGECSDKDVKEEFIFEGIQIVPRRLWLVGMVWLTGENVKRSVVND